MKSTTTSAERSEDLSRAEFAYIEIMAKLRRGELRAGQRLREAELAVALGISRTPVREAIRRIASEGLIEVVAGRGLVVAEFDKQQVRELYALRAVLEGAAAQLAARHASPSELELMHAVLEQSQETANSPEELMQLNIQFHRAIHEAAHNRYLERALAQMSDSLALLPGTTFSEPKRAAAAYAEHGAIFDALKRGKADLAEKAARHHIEMAGASRMRLMFTNQDRAPSNPAPNRAPR
jgi:DNA-binding GntR family transcriptional regulator